MSILARLRETTAPAHEKLDAGVELERRLARREDRIGLVQAFHAFHSAPAPRGPWRPQGAQLMKSAAWIPLLVAAVLGLKSIEKFRGVA